MPVTLLCTVRDCHLPLVRDERRFVCEHGHSFDLARSGYCNLLLPQDRKSKTPGDSPEAVVARRRFLDRGFAQPLQQAILGMLELSADDAVLDTGCGEGSDLMAVRRTFGAEAHGVDISVSAIDAAAKRDKSCTWIVANADRFLPYADGSFRAVLSITARLHAPELRRVVREDGAALIALPAPDDVIELREAVLGDGTRRDRVERTVADFAPHFELVRREEARTVAHLDHEAIVDVMWSSYRGLRTRERERLDTLDAMDVTLSRDLLLFRPR